DKMSRSPLESERLINFFHDKVSDAQSKEQLDNLKELYKDVKATDKVWGEVKRTELVFKESKDEDFINLGKKLYRRNFPNATGDLTDADYYTLGLNFVREKQDHAVYEFKRLKDDFEKEEFMDYNDYKSRLELFKKVLEQKKNQAFKNDIFTAKGMISDMSNDEIKQFN